MIYTNTVILKLGGGAVDPLKQKFFETISPVTVFGESRMFHKADLLWLSSKVSHCHGERGLMAIGHRGRQRHGNSPHMPAHRKTTAQLGQAVSAEHSGAREHRCPGAGGQFTFVPGKPAEPWPALVPEFES